MWGIRFCNGFPSLLGFAVYLEFFFLRLLFLLFHLISLPIFYCLFKNLFWSHSLPLQLLLDPAPPPTPHPTSCHFLLFLSPSSTMCDVQTLLDGWPLTRAWSTYQGPHPWRTLTLPLPAATSSQCLLPWPCWEFVWPEPCTGLAHVFTLAVGSYM